MKALWIITIAAGLTVSAAAQQMGTKQQNTNPNERERAQENAQERASGINDTVDIVSGPDVQNLTGSSATLNWTTNKNAASRVRYGTDAEDPAQHAYEPGGSTQHSVQLTNLKPNTTYHYEIETRGGKDRYKGSFHTPPQ
jgi:hypothetical protein